MSIDTEKTKRYYTHLSRNNLCDCAYCQNYYRQVKSAYPEVAVYLSDLGVDIEKPFETMPLEIENGNLEYCACQYIVCGSCSDSYAHKIGDVEFHKTSCHPDTELEEPHFVLEFGPIILKAEFDVSG